MCGIVAAFARRGMVRPENLEAATAALRHRGPDALNVWRAPDGRAALGHTRLSIIDLACGHQPIASEDDRRRIVVNGEFYDFERLQRELESRGHRLRTRSDSEVALHLFEERGGAALEELRGEFAFALWDESRRRLFAARDRFGIKPLYYAEADGVLWLASEIKALAAAGVRLRWDQESVHRSIFANLALDRTLFAGVRQVPPGCWLEADDAGVRLGSYWQPDYPRAGGSDADADGWIERLRAETETAVRLRMRADVPVGCLLSGGLDSSAVLGLAQRLAGAPVKAFTVAFDHPRFDESPAAARTAAELGAEFHPIRMTNADFAAAFPDAVWVGEGIHYNAHGAARYLLSRAVREAGITVALAGEGADELSAGYQFCERALGMGGVVPEVRWDRGLLDVLAGRVPETEVIRTASARLRDHARLLGFPDLMIGHLAGQAALSMGLIDHELLAPQGVEDPYLAFFRQFPVADQMEGREPIKQVLYLWLKTGFANYILGGERMDMAFAVEQRLPFLDHKLFEVARELPGSLLRRDGVVKWPLREAWRPFVPDAVYRGVKQPFLAPPSTLQEGSPMLALAQDVLRSDAARSVPFLHAEAMTAFMDRLKGLPAAERAPLDPVVLLLLSVVILHQRYGL